MLSQLSYRPKATFTDPLAWVRIAVSYDPTLVSSRRPVFILDHRASVTARADELVGLGRVELPTLRLSGARSSQLSYRPS